MAIIRALPRSRAAGNGIAHAVARQQRDGVLALARVDRRDGQHAGAALRRLGVGVLVVGAAHDARTVAYREVSLDRSGLVLADRQLHAGTVEAPVQQLVTHPLSR